MKFGVSLPRAEIRSVQPRMQRTLHLGGEEDMRVATDQSG